MVLEGKLTVVRSGSLFSSLRSRSRLSTFPALSSTMRATTADSPPQRACDRLCDRNIPSIRMYVPSSLPYRSSLTLNLAGYTLVRSSPFLQPFLLTPPLAVLHSLCTYFGEEAQPVSMMSGSVCGSGKGRFVQCIIIRWDARRLLLLFCGTSACSRGYVLFSAHSQFAFDGPDLGGERSGRREVVGSALFPV